MMSPLLKVKFVIVDICTTYPLNYLGPKQCAMTALKT